MKSLYESILDDEDVLVDKSIKYANNPFLILKYDYIIPGIVSDNYKLNEIYDLFKKYKVMDEFPVDCYLGTYRNQLCIEINSTSQPIVEIGENAIAEYSNLFKKIQSKYKDFNKNSCLVNFYEWEGRYNGTLEMYFKTKANYLKWIRNFTKKYEMKKIDNFFYFL